MAEGKGVICNVCGRTLRMINGILQEDILEVKKEWGYFSKKDLDTHHFIMCEECYDKMIKNFVVPIEAAEKNEVL